jgi:hypothetical protein
VIINGVAVPAAMPPTVTLMADGADRAIDAEDGDRPAGTITVSATPELTADEEMAAALTVLPA